jgi:hypothetical protein
MEICPAAGNLKLVSVLATAGPEQVYLLLNSLPRYVFIIPPILNKVRPPGTDLGVVDATILEPHTEICINGEENRVQPPEKCSDH